MDIKIYNVNEFEILCIYIDFGGLNVYAYENYLTNIIDIIFFLIVENTNIYKREVGENFFLIININTNYKFLRKLIIIYKYTYIIYI